MRAYHLRRPGSDGSWTSSRGRGDVGGRSPGKRHDGQYGVGSAVGDVETGIGDVDALGAPYPAERVGRAGGGSLCHTGGAGLVLPA